MQNILQNVQLAHRIFNSDIEPEHDVDTFCGCDIHQYLGLKVRRLGVQNRWSEAVIYPGKRRQTFSGALDCSSARLTDFQVKSHIMTATRQVSVSFPRIRIECASFRRMATLAQAI
jgi:hypothetical protein